MNGVDRHIGAHARDCTIHSANQGDESTNGTEHGIVRAVVRSFVHSKSVFLVFERDCHPLGCLQGERIAVCKFLVVGVAVTPRRWMILVRPGAGVDVISHDRMAKK